MERALRKVKPWLDPTEKLKHRHTALLLFLELTGDHEQVVFFREHRGLLYEYGLTVWRYFTAKLAGDPEYRLNVERLLQQLSSAGQSTTNVKEWEQHHFRAGIALRLAFKWAGEELLSGRDEKYLSDFVEIVTRLLHPGNHQWLRREGMRLVLAWLGNAKLPAGVFGDLFGEAVRLHPFVLTGEDEQEVFKGCRQAPNDHIGGPSRVSPPLLQTSLTPLQQSQRSLADLLHLITHDVSLSKPASVALWEMLQTAYLLPAYSSADDPPPAFQSIVIEYMALWTVQLLPESDKSCNSIPVSCFVLSEHLLTNDLDLVHKVLRAAHRLPFACPLGIKSAQYVVRQWVLAGKERRPAHLTSEASRGYLCDYLSMTLALFDPTKSAIGLQQEQIAVFKEAIAFLRHFILQWKSMSHDAVSVLLCVSKALLSCPPEKKYSVIVTPGMAEELAGLLGETLFTAFIRCGLLQQADGMRGLFVELNGMGRELSNWPLLVNSWSEVVSKLSDVFIQELAKGQLKRLDSQSQQSGDSLIAGRSSPRPSDFNSWWLQLPVDGTERLFLLLRNLLPVFGPMQSIRRPDCHNSIIRALVGVSERLLSCKSPDLVVPIFEAFPMLVDAAVDVNEGKSEARRLALGMTARLICSRLVATSDADVLRLLDAVVLGLETTDRNLLRVAVESAEMALAAQLPTAINALPSAVFPVLSQPDCPAFQSAVRILQQLVLGREYKESSWNVIKGLFSCHRGNMTRLDVLLPAISIGTCFYLSDQDIAKEGINMLLEAITPYELQIPVASIPALEAVLAHLRDVQLQLGDDLERHIIRRLIVAVRSTMLTYVAGNPKEAQLDQLGGWIIPLIGRFLSSVDSGWLDREIESRESLISLLYEAQTVHSGLHFSKSGEAAAHLSNFIMSRQFSDSSMYIESAVDAKTPRVHFAITGDTIISLHPSDDKHFLMVCRTASGKAVWRIAESDDIVKELPLLPVNVGQFARVLKRIEPYEEYSGPWFADDIDADGFAGLPRWKGDGLQSNMLSRLADYLDFPTESSHSAVNNGIAELCRERLAMELAVSERFEAAETPDTRHVSALKRIDAEPSKRHQPLSALIRKWLSAMGVLSVEAFESKQISVIRHSERFIGDLGFLDAIDHVPCFSASIRYVSPYDGEGVSRAYVDFIDSLGWPEGDRRTYCSPHGRFLFAEGSNTVESTCRIIFNEHLQEYKPHGGMEIVIEPIDFNQCRVILHNVSSQWLGPLRSNSIIPLTCIGPLLRSTLSLLFTPATHPYTIISDFNDRYNERQEAIKKVIKVHCPPISRKDEYIRGLMLLPESDASNIESLESPGVLSSIKAAGADQIKNYAAGDGKLMSPLQASRTLFESAVDDDADGGVREEVVNAEQAMISALATVGL